MGYIPWCHFSSDLFQSTNFPRMSPSLNKKWSLSSRTTLVPPYSGRTLSPTFRANWLNLSTLCFGAPSSSYYGCLQYFSSRFFWKHNASFGYNFYSTPSDQYLVKEGQRLSKCLPAVTLAAAVRTLLSGCGRKERPAVGPAGHVDSGKAPFLSHKCPPWGCTRKCSDNFL